MVGYKCPHPLEKKLVLRIKPKIDTEDRDIDYSYISKNILIKTCDNLIYLINELIVEWNTITQQTSDIVEEDTDIKPELIQKTDIFKEYNQDYEKKPEKAEQPEQSAEPEQPKAELKKKRIVKKK